MAQNVAGGKRKETIIEKKISQYAAGGKWQLFLY